MSQTGGRPDKRLLDESIDKPTPPNEEMDVISATIVLERAGVDLNTMNDGLKERPVREVDEMRGRNEEYRKH